MKAIIIIAGFLPFAICGQQLRSYKADDLGHVHCVAFLPGGKTFLTGCSQHSIKSWDVESGKEIRIFQSKSDHTGAVHGLAVLPDGNSFVSANHNANLYDITQGKIVRGFEGKHIGGVKAVAVSPNGKIVATSGTNGSPSVEIWEIATGRHLQSLEGHWGHVNSLAFHPGGRILASGSNDHTIRLWELSEGYFSPASTLEGYAEHVHALSFSYDGKYLASGNQDGSIGIWDVKSRTELKKFSGHTRHVHAVTFSPDGNFLASGSNDHTIKLWDVEKGNLITTYQGHTGPVHSVAFSPDGYTLLSGSGDRTVRLWDCSSVNIMYVYKNEINADINSNARLFAPKDEFESTSDYEKRKLDAENYKNSVYDKYKQNYPALKKQKIRNSYKVISFPIDRIGVYDADRQVYPISVNGATENISMPPADARSFKENLRNVEVKGVQQLLENCIATDLFNIQITHPITGITYAFGKQKKPLYMDEEVVTASSGEVGVPSLNATVKFKDGNNNNILEGGEAAQLIFTLVNEGKGTAKNIKINILSDAGQSINFDKVLPIAGIAAGQSQIVSVHLRGDHSLTNGEAYIQVNFEEERGFQPNPLEINLSTQAPKVPQLIFSDVAVTEIQGNKNNTIEKNETIEATVTIQNKGLGNAIDTRAVIKIDDPNIVAINPAMLTHLLGVLHSGESKTIKFSFAVNNNYTGTNKLPLRVIISESNTKYGGAFSLGLELKKNNQGATGINIQKTPAPSDFTDFSSDVDENIPVTTIRNPDAIAVVIGNSAYTKAKKVDYAINDARAIKNYLVKSMGFREGNILYYENASYSDLRTLFGDKGNPQGKLYNTIKEDKSDIFIYYSGHGAPGLKDHKTYFVPVESDPQYVELTGYPTDLLYENLALMPAKSVTIILDACFSGTNIYENISPIVIKSKGAGGVKNGVSLTSSTNSQVSCWYNDKYHGMFTYFLLKGIQNKNADFNKDEMLTMSELYQYVSDKTEGVPYNARRIHGIEQTPVMEGNERDRVLVKY